MSGDLHMIGAYDISRRPAAPYEEIVDMETVIDEMVERAGGDERMAIRRLVIGRLHVDEQVSAGYVRRKTKG